jgi:hypothetical protein
MIGVEAKRPEDAAVAKGTATPYAIITNHEARTRCIASRVPGSLSAQSAFPQRKFTRHLNQAGMDQEKHFYFRKIHFIGPRRGARTNKKRDGNSKKGRIYALLLNPAAAGEFGVYRTISKKKDEKGVWVHGQMPRPTISPHSFPPPRLAPRP